MYWKPLVDLADHVVVGHEHVVEEDVVGALVAHRPDAVDRDAGMVERHEEQRDAVVLRRSGSVRAPTQYHSAKCADVVHVFCPLRRQPSPSRVGLELHRRGVGAGVGLAVADRELDLVAQDLRQELLLQLLAAVAQDRLADDADALADLRAAPAGERLVEQVLVDAVAFLAALLLGPGDAEPALLAELAP